MNKSPKDKNGKEYQIGHLFTEGYAGELIWGLAGEILKPPIGVFVGEKVDERKRAGSGWYVKTHSPGLARYEGELVDLYIDTWDGEFMGNWDDTEVIGDGTPRYACLKKMKKWKEEAESLNFPEMKGEMEISEVGMEMLQMIQEREKWKPTNKQQEVLDAYQKKLDNLTEEEIKAMQEMFDKWEL